MQFKTLLDTSKRIAGRASQAVERHVRRELEYRERAASQRDRAALHFNEYNNAFGANEVPPAPLILRIEVVNLCNANCVFCTYQYQTREIETMSFETFKNAIDQYTALGGRRVSFTPLVGDALIDRGLEEKVAYARQFPQYETLELWTNAILLTRERFEALVESGINEFHISMSGFSADEYELLFRNKSYPKIIKNLIEIAQSEAVKKVKFVVWARTGAADADKAPDYVKLRDFGTVGIILQRQMFSWHGQIKEEDLPGNMFLMKPSQDQTKPCFHLWAGFTVLSNGDMTVCGCTDIDGVGLPLGNVRDAPIDAHLRDGRWEKLRDSFVAGSPPDFCKGCDMYWPLDMPSPE